MILGMDADEEEGHRGSFGSKKKKMRAKIPHPFYYRVVTMD